MRLCVYITRDGPVDPAVYICNYILIDGRGVGIVVCGIVCDKIAIHSKELGDPLTWLGADRARTIRKRALDTFGTLTGNAFLSTRNPQNTRRTSP